MGSRRGLIEEEPINDESPPISGMLWGEHNDEHTAVPRWFPASGQAVATGCLSLFVVLSLTAIFLNVYEAVVGDRLV